MVDPALFLFRYFGEHAAFFNVGARQLAGDVSFRGDKVQLLRHWAFVAFEFRPRQDSRVRLRTLTSTTWIARCHLHLLE